MPCVLTFTFIFILALTYVDACSTADKIKCSAAMLGCGATCICTIPACECCPVCLACVTATVADCCDCLFPGWSGCYSFNKTGISFDKIKMLDIKKIKLATHCSYTECGGRNETICCPETHKAVCKCSQPNNSVCQCIYSNVSTGSESCAGIQCKYRESSICCPVGISASCQCVNGYSVCGCS